MSDTAVSDTVVARRGKKHGLHWTEDKIERLRALRAAADGTSQFVILTGRRRVDKTELVKRAFSDEPFVYLFVARKAEADIVSSFVDEVIAVPGPRSAPRTFFRCGPSRAA